MQTKDTNFNWRAIREFANSLTEDQLDNPAIVFGEEVSYKLTGAEINPEDHYIDKHTGEIGGTLQECEKYCTDADELFNPEDFVLNIPKGMPLLYFITDIEGPPHIHIDILAIPSNLTGSEDGK